jgi:hypothetical protein
MPGTKRMLREAAPNARETIEALVRLRADEYRTQGLSFFAAQLKSANEIFSDVRQVYERGGADALNNKYGASS